MSYLRIARSVLVASVLLWVAALLLPTIGGDEVAEPAQLVGIVAVAGIALSALACVLIQLNVWRKGAR